MSRKRIFVDVVFFLLVAGVMAVGILLWQDRKYNLVSILIAAGSCVPFYYAYERRQGGIRRMVILAVMVGLAVAGRFLFAMLPGFKPVTAIVVLTGIYLGAEGGFLTGSLAALISNMFFGQGPWTPFQMAAWGTLGFAAGLPGLRRILKKRIFLAVYGFAAGLAYSAVMDIWTVLSYETGFSIARYALSLLSSLPFSLVYGVSNVMFLMLCAGPVGRKLERIRVRHGIFDDESGRKGGYRI